MLSYKKRIFHNDETCPFFDLTSLLHDSYKERLESGLNMGPATITLKEFKEHTKESYIVCLFDNEKPIAMGVLSIREKIMVKYGSFEFLAVSPLQEYRRKGLGGEILKEAIRLATDLGLEFVTSSTAVEAISSVKCHIKAGFKIYRVTHFPNRNYLSYVFYYPIKKSLLPLLISILRVPLVFITTIITKKV